MTLRKKSACVLICLLPLLAIPGCRKGEKAPAPSGQPDRPPVNDLRVLNVNPQGKTATARDSQTIVAIFDRPMVALDALPQDGGPAVLKLNPPFAGKTRWLGSKTLTFSPDKKFPSATEIQVTIPAGTLALDGSSLKGDYKWTFETVEPRLVRHFPQDQQKWLGLDTQVLLVFNQEVEKN